MKGTVSVFKVIDPCCELLQKSLLSGCSKINYEDTTNIFVMKDSDGHNAEEIQCCPYCGELLRVFE